uniref:Uncharacterized protein n=1 Tax=Panagrolaimus sp. JU765 TaxID=591449 RepID=A0AC34Q0R8_9BILA
MVRLISLLVWTCLIVLVKLQAPYYTNHYYGQNAADIASKRISPQWAWPEPYKANGPDSTTLAPHLCGFNPFTRRCMDPDNLCPGRCMNFNYLWNSRYDCRCLVI